MKHMFIWCVCIVCVHLCVYLQVHNCTVLVGRSDGNSGCWSLMSTLFSTRFLLCCSWLRETGILREQVLTDTQVFFHLYLQPYWHAGLLPFVSSTLRFRQVNLLKVNPINESQRFKQDLLNSRSHNPTSHNPHTGTFHGHEQVQVEVGLK